MKRVRYSKYVPSLADDLSMEDLMDALSDFLLESGFQDMYSRFYQMGDEDRSMEALKEAIRNALLNGDLFDEEMREQLE
ncbi:MAG TPA: hypothetical protein VFU86_04655, partial [Terriglobales bacterium]|nr:hypothetical protein [Terriglobales bacterium]